MNNPYEQYENTELWKIVENAINQLIKNQDVVLTTQKEYVIGFLCKQISERD
jgi:hypothetical protein